MFERLFGNREQDAAVADRIPPGQYRTEKFPVLHYGSVPNTDLATWDFKVFGEVDSPFTLTWERVQGAAPQDGHDRHPLRDPLDQARHDLGGRPDPGDPRPAPACARRRPTCSPIPSRATRPTCRSTVLDDDDVLLADTFDGAAARAGARLAAPPGSSRSGTSGRAPSGSAASSSSTTTASASGSATATTTTPIPGRKSATRSRAPRAAGEVARARRRRPVSSGGVRPSQDRRTRRAGAGRGAAAPGRAGGRGR